MSRIGHSDLSINISEDQLAKALLPVIKCCLQDYKRDFVFPEQLLTRKQAAAFLSIGLSTLRKYTEEGIFIAHRVGDLQRYKRSELIDAFQTNFRLR